MVGEGVDRLELIYEFSDLGIANRSYQPADVDLSEMEIGLRFFALLWSSSESIPGI